MFFSKEYILLADIGATNSRIALSDGLNIVLKKEYMTADFTNMTELLHKFFSENGNGYRIRTAAIAVAGPIIENTVVLTNAPFVIDQSHITLNTPIKKAILLNDFEALGYSIDILTQNDYVEITNLGTNSGKTIGVIGAGTGLGAAILSFSGNTHTPIASEAGHMEIPININDKGEMELAKYLMKKKLYNSSEDIVSSRGILNIYNFLLTKKVKHNKNIRDEISKSSRKQELITKYALEDKDLLCTLCLETFIHYYAKAAKNLALASNCRELFIGGGIAPKILPALKEEFVDEFIKHNDLKMHELLEGITVRIITNPNASLLGCLNALRHKS